MLFEPFAPLFELSRALDRRLAGTVPSTVPVADMVPSFVPAADVVVSDEDVKVVMDVPGLDADELTIELQGDLLTVRGERPLDLPVQDEEGQGRLWQRLERGFGKFERVLRLPEGLDADKINASIENGVLTLHIPKTEARKPRRIEIMTGGRQSTIEGTASEQRELAGSAA